MAEIRNVQFYDNEIVKAEDFQFGEDSFREAMAVVFNQSFGATTAKVIVNGLIVQQMPTPSMNVQVTKGLGFDPQQEQFCYNSATSAPIPFVAAHLTLARIDIMQMQMVDVQYDAQQRALIDPNFPIGGNQSAATFSYQTLKTKIKHIASFQSKAGVPGTGIAPTVDPGWVKIAEIVIPANSTGILTANIINASARLDGSPNTGWATEVASTFVVGSIPMHKADNITSGNTVHGIRQGPGNGFDADKLDGMQPNPGALINTIMQRDEAGNAAIADPRGPLDIVNKNYADATATATRTYADATATATKTYFKSRGITADSPVLADANNGTPGQFATVCGTAAQCVAANCPNDGGNGGTYQFWNLFTFGSGANGADGVRVSQIATNGHNNDVMPHWLFIRRCVDNVWSGWIRCATIDDIGVEASARANVDSYLDNRINAKAPMPKSGASAGDLGGWVSLDASYYYLVLPANGTWVYFFVSNYILPSTGVAVTTTTTKSGISAGGGTSILAIEVTAISGRYTGFAWRIS